LSSRAKRLPAVLFDAVGFFIAQLAFLAYLPLLTYLAFLAHITALAFGEIQPDTARAPLCRYSKKKGPMNRLTDGAIEHLFIID
jgi:hypothetical protein